MVGGGNGVSDGGAKNVAVGNGVLVETTIVFVGIGVKVGGTVLVGKGVKVGALVPVGGITIVGGIKIVGGILGVMNCNGVGFNGEIVGNGVPVLRRVGVRDGPPSPMMVLVAVGVTCSALALSGAVPHKTNPKT